MNNLNQFSVSFDRANNIAVFKDTRTEEPLYSCKANPAEIAEMCRYIACFFLKQAHDTEQTDDYTICDYTCNKEWEQILKMFNGSYHNGFIHSEKK